MDASDTSRVPDILLERYLAGDLTPEQRQSIEARRESSEEVRRRLSELEQERDAFLAADPPEAFAHRLATQLAVEKERERARPAPRRLWWAWVLAPSAAVAATVLIAVVYVRVGERSGAVFAPQSPALEAADEIAPAAEPTPTPQPAIGETAADKPSVGSTKTQAAPSEPAEPKQELEDSFLEKKPKLDLGRALKQPKKKEVRAQEPEIAPAAPRRGGGRPAALDATPGAKPAVGTLYVRTTPWTIVTVDGKPYGRTPLVRLPLSPGRHDLRLRNPQLGIDVRRKIRIEVGKSLKLDLDLKRAQPAER